jgi:hypothetical protein
MSGKNKSADMEHFAPKTRKIRVAVAKLVPDPNNPRFTTRDTDHVSPDKVLDDAITGETLRKMTPPDDIFRIADLCNSICENGWQPVDAMFVRKLAGTADRYVVLEGNRRLSAINRLLHDEQSPSELKNSLKEIDVLEVLTEGQEESEIRNQITYLLGVRHHGSLKKWSPFAQAANIYLRYKDLTGQTDETFALKAEFVEELASSLSISSANVRERLKVYCSMRIISQEVIARNPPGEVKDRHYSLVEEALKRKDLRNFFTQDDISLELSPESVERFVKLCHFDKPANEAVKTRPITDPTEWRPFGKIITDENIQEREENTRRVTENNEKPSVVWAKRSAQLRQLTWEVWLRRLQGKLARINMGDNFEDQDAVQLVKDLRSVLLRLKTKEQGA